MIDSFPGGRDGKVVVGCYGGGGGRAGRGGERLCTCLNIGGSSPTTEIRSR